jgi:predicted lipoprotein
LQALSTEIHTEAQALAADWHQPDGGFARQLAEAGRHPADGSFTSADQALSDVLNLLIAGLDAVKVRKLGKALEKSGDQAALERIEAWRSGTSLDHIRDNLRGFENKRLSHNARTSKRCTRRLASCSTYWKPRWPMR